MQYLSLVAVQQNRGGGGGLVAAFPGLFPSSLGDDVPIPIPAAGLLRKHHSSDRVADRALPAPSLASLIPAPEPQPGLGCSGAASLLLGGSPLLCPLRGI